MAIDKNTITHMAKLSKFIFTDEELQNAAAELESVLEHIKKVQRIDTEGIAPTVSTIELTNVLRDDIISPSMDNEQLLKSASQSYDGAYLVPRVVE